MGHALLVDVGGSGKQSLSRLSSSICDYTTIMITISATYGVNDLEADLQAMYAVASVQQKSVTFLFTDNQITNEHHSLGQFNVARMHVANHPFGASRRAFGGDVQLFCEQHGLAILFHSDIKQLARSACEIHLAAFKDQPCAIFKLQRGCGHRWL